VSDLGSFGLKLTNLATF